MLLTLAGTGHELHPGDWPAMLDAIDARTSRRIPVKRVLTGADSGDRAIRREGAVRRFFMNSRSCRGTGAVIALVVTVAMAAILAAPARAEGAAPSVLTLMATPEAVEAGGDAVLSGRLTSSGAGLPYASLLVSGSTDGATWVELATLATDADGAFALDVRPSGDYRETRYRVDFAGNDEYVPVTAHLTIASHAVLTAPAVPLRVGRGTAFRLTGELRPRHPEGAEAVLLEAYRRESGVWVLRQTAVATVADTSDGSTYAKAVKLGLAGMWRVRARHADDAHAPSVSPWSATVLVGPAADQPIWNRDGSMTIPETMASRLNARQLVVVTGGRLGARDGTLRLYQYRAGDWTRVMSVRIRFGSRGLTNGGTRRAGSRTTPTGIWRLPGYGFGMHSGAPAGTKLDYRRIRRTSWWSSERNATYNTWVESRTYVYGEHLADYPVQYEYAISTGYNAKPNPQVYGRGSGIFVHVHGRAYTAGCISLPRLEMARLLVLLDPELRPACAVGTRLAGTSTAITAY